jgi:uncharacterized protein YkwD
MASNKALAASKLAILIALPLLGACNLITGAESLEIVDEEAGAGGQGGSSAQGGQATTGAGAGTTTGSGGAGAGTTTGSGASGGTTTTTTTGSGGPSCGDGACNGGETCATCAGDCGACCGNGMCDNGETCDTCAGDCGMCDPCGNGMCDNGETCDTCASDCGACTTCQGSSDATTPLDSEEAAFLGIINQYRAQNGLGALSACTSLNRAAQGHSEDMRDQNYFSHTGQNGSSPWERACDACYELGCGPMTAMAENIAAGNSGAQATFDQWKNSPGHNANMLGASFTVIGIGRATGGGQYGVYWTNVFGGDAEPSCN